LTGAIIQAADEVLGKRKKKCGKKDLWSWNQNIANLKHKK
jgi:hypothetical protein